jgi:hypothetical protein
MSKDLMLVAPCGLYCGVCSTLHEEACHGCGCDADDCFAAKKHRVCTIYQCVRERGLQDCSFCDEVPCTTLIQFTFDPIMKTHLPVLNNLARRQKIGMEAWVKEQQKYWKENPARFDKWISFHGRCKRKRREAPRRSSHSQTRTKYAPE